MGRHHPCGYSADHACAPRGWAGLRRHVVGGPYDHGPPQVAEHGGPQADEGKQGQQGQQGGPYQLHVLSCEEDGRLLAPEAEQRLTLHVRRVAVRLVWKAGKRFREGRQEADDYGYWWWVRREGGYDREDAPAYVQVLVRRCYRQGRCKEFDGAKMPHANNS